MVYNWSMESNYSTSILGRETWQRILFRPCPNTWRAEPRKKTTLSFFRRNFTPAKSRKQGVFFFRGCRRTRRRGEASVALALNRSVRGSLESPRTPRVRLVSIRVAFKIHSNFVQWIPPDFQLWTLEIARVFKPFDGFGGSSLETCKSIRTSKTGVHIGVSFWLLTGPYPKIWTPILYSLPI